MKSLTFYGRRPARRSATVCRRSRDLGAERTRRLKALASEERFVGNPVHLALFNMFAGVLAAYLHKISGSYQIALGVPLSERSSASLEHSAGVIIQAAPFHATIARDETFNSLIARVQVESAETARRYRAGLLRQGGTSFDVIFYYHSGVPVDFYGFPVCENNDSFGTGRYSFSLHVRHPERESILLEFDFHPDVFAETQGCRAIEHFLNTLDAFLMNPQQRLDRLDVLSAAEKRRLLSEFNATAAVFSADACIHDLIEEQCERTPDAAAVLFEHQLVTYRVLNQRANALAHHLRSLGVGPEVPVGICLERSVDLVIGLLAILKAGGAYVPLDPDYPRERLSLMIEDVGLSLIVTHSRSRERLRINKASLVCLDSDPESTAGTRENPESGAAPENLAYIIFTSGSTGRPKGAMNTHRGICNRLLWMQRAFALTSTDRVLQKTPMSFDVSVWEFFWPLMTGAAVVMARPGGHQDSTYLARVISEQQITTLHFVPSMLQAFLQERTLSNRCRSLKRVICSGEALNSELQNRFFRTLDAELHNLYGPTEAAIDVTWWVCRKEENSSSVPIGFPIANTQIYLLDSAFEPLPIGAAGELYIGGAGVARGYIHRAELTAERFLPDPFSGQDGARLYKTGDLARYRDDGSIEFLGRIDHQVKIRGFRIELDEIESVLRQHPGIGDAVVVTYDDAHTDNSCRTAVNNQLVAYTVPRAGEHPPSRDLRAFLRHKLPEYMIPSAFVHLSEMPLAPNGKLDRRALPPPEAVRAAGCSSYVFPETDAEKTIASLWADVFNRDDIGIHDNFFDLGGHSLIALQLASRLRDAFHVEINLRTIFEKPTIAGLAQNLQTAASEEPQPQCNSGLLETSAESRPLSFAQQRLWFLDQLEPGTPLYNISEAFRLSGPVDVHALESSLNEIVRRHEVLRTTFTSTAGNAIQVIASSLRISLETRDLRQDSEQDREREARRLAREEAERPFDLLKGPLLRGALLRLDDENHVLLVTMHHIVSDGWSMAIFLRELTTLYNALSAGRPSPLAELAMQYSDYAEWQQRCLKEGELASQLDYWKAQLAGLPTLQLRTDRPRPPIQRFRGDQLIVMIPGPLAAALKLASQREGVTLFMLLLAGFKTMLYRYSGQQDIAVGIPIAGRSRFEFEPLIGCFVNTLVLRTEVSGERTFRQLVSQLREICLSAYSRQDLPFEKLVEELRPQRDLSRNPLFQVLFQVRNVPKERLQLSSVTSDEFLVDRKIARFDLSLEILEVAGQLRCSFSYNTDLFDRSSIDEMSQCLLRLLQTATQLPDSSIRELISAPKSNPAVAVTPPARLEAALAGRPCVHRLIEAQAAETPGAIAVVFEQETLSYAELNRRANQLAHCLRRRGLGPDLLVGLYLERSAAMVVALLATLKAGAAYVPLDPDYPQERLEFMIDDARPAIIITDQRLSDRASACATPVLVLDEDSEELSRQTGANLVHEPNLEDLVYVIYTSGSTGKPKGVMVEHGQLTSYCAGVIRRLQPNQGSSFALVQPLMFDSSVTTVFVSLLSGGSLHVLTKDQALDPNHLAHYFQSTSIDYLKITPSHLAALQSGAMPTMPSRALILGGEASQLEWVSKLQTVAPHCKIFNHYGPTETTVGVLMYRMGEAELTLDACRIPLGHPLAGTRAYVLNSELEIVPSGAIGELYIGGNNVTRGYLNHPELTAEKFIPDPFAEKFGTRLYRTGDLARYLADGDIEFLGRADHQVKIRGFRVETGEIESALKEHPDVRGAVVLARDDAAGQKQLIGYVLAALDRSPAKTAAYVLPNGIQVAQLNRNETDYLYQEIFERQAYLRHGISIQDGDTIFDVGANIGLFMLFADQLASRLKIYSFEPNPDVFAILKANASLLASEVKLFNYGLADTPKTGEFTYFRGFSLFSGFYADAEQEKEVVRNFMANQQENGIAEMGELLKEAQDILDRRFSGEVFRAQLKTLSAVLEQEQIDRIDLLKINVEKSELDVLKGIKNSDWQKIQQIVLEVDTGANLETIVALLRSHSYEFTVEQDPLLINTQLRYVYAIRTSSERKLIEEQGAETHIRALPVRSSAKLSSESLRSFLREKLPEYMVPTAVVFLDALPLTENGKLDRRALPEAIPDMHERYVAPRDATEERLARIWAELLKIESIGVHQNFFDLGGHSLLAIQAVSRIRNVFRIELPVRRLFEYPTIAELAVCIAPLTNEAAPVRSPRVVDLGEEAYPLSFAQERFWFLNQLDPGNPAYQIAYGFRIKGELDVDALERCLAEIVRRHEILRTTIRTDQGRPVQVALDPWSFHLRRIDLSGRSVGEADTAIESLYREECRRPFDLAEDLLLRGTLLRIDERDFALFITSHHIVWDHWCIQLFFNELSGLYRAYVAGQASPFGELPLQYKQYALWQRQALRSAELAKGLAYWKEQLKDASPTLNLPTDYPRKPLRTRRGGRRSVGVSKELSNNLAALAREAGVSLFMVFLAAFQTLLHRLTGQIDIIVGTPVAGRERSDTEELIGLFLNSLALRTDLSGNPTFRELLFRVREVALGAYDHQSVPFEKIVEDVQPQRDLTRTPVFQVFINMYNFKEAELAFDRLSVQPIARLESSPQFDLEFFIREREDGTYLSFGYDADLFEASTIDRLLGQFQVLLGAVISDPERKISEVPMLTHAEQAKLLIEWNDTARAYPQEQCIHQLFEEQAARAPDATAVVCGSRRFTYRELNHRANQLARYLGRHGVGPEVLVGVCLGRSLEMIIALLGILKSGGTYLPLDRAYPRDWLELILDDAGAEVLLTEENFVSALPQTRAKLICLEQVGPVIAQESGLDLAIRTDADQLAYVIYTSGSTGKPKGVAIAQRSAVSLLHWAKELLSQEDIAGTLASTSICFDLSVFEIFVPLSWGGTVILADNALSLSTLAAAGEVTLINTVPSAMAELLKLGAVPASVRKVCLAGEALPTALVRRIYQQTSVLSVIDLYGPTEDTTYSTCALRSATCPATIGRPIANTHIYLLDSFLNLVPIGVIGELYIGGSGLARGYQGRPALTAERFIPNPFSATGGERLYRTGDLARYLEDGNIEFLGRADQQVKIRGFRVELGEVEAVLAQHPAVGEAVVVARDDRQVGSGDQRLQPVNRLVGYVTSQAGLDVPALRNFLKTKLPEYMVPSTFVLLESMPHSPNGKIDRKGLPTPGQSRPELETAFIAPRNRIEASIAKVWAEILELDAIGIYDNFFDVGGHSLLATRVISRLRGQFDIDLPLRVLFEQPTVCALAEYIDHLIGALPKNEGSNADGERECIEV